MGGFGFSGDDRNFELQESYFDPNGRVKKAGETTSRIWQRFSVNTIKDGSLNADNTINECQSNTSHNDVFIVGKLTNWSGTQKYEKKILKPRGEVKGKVITPHGGQMTFGVNTHYVGENHSFTLSETSQEKFGGTFVPGIDVRMRLNVSVERINKYMDVTVLVYGDGFPNCEAFIKDAKGNKLFLGTHIRKGQAGTQLWGDGKEIFFGHAFRIEVNSDGSFGSRMWSFTHLLGTRGEAEPVGNFDKIDNPGYGTVQSPLYIAAKRPIETVWDKMMESYLKGPSDRGLTRSQWNSFHLNRNPNEGR